MTSLFFSISNKLGIACASDSDHTIYQLAKEVPLAVAVCPYSPIPWARIIEDYRRKGEPEHHDSLIDYVSDFSDHLEKYEGKEEWEELSDDNRNIIFMGYGNKDLYPSVYDTHADILSGNLCLEDGQVMEISHDNDAQWNYIGNYNNISPILTGATNSVRDIFQQKCLEAFNIYKARVMEKFAGTKYEQRARKCLDSFNAEAVIHNELGRAFYKTTGQVAVGLDTFSIEEMVYACENIVNASIRLNHLHSGGKTPLGYVKEIAVITRAEGLTWIRHSLFAI